MILTVFVILYVIHHILITEKRWQRKHRQSRSDQNEMPIATASGGGVANLSHDLFFILSYNKQFFLYAAN